MKINAIQKFAVLIILITATSLTSLKKTILNNVDGKPLMEKEREVALKVSYKISVKGHLNSLRLKVCIPGNIKNRQALDDIEFSVQPDSVYTKYNNTYALFKFYDINDDIKITMKEKLRIYQSIGVVNNDNDSTLNEYLKPEENIESESLEIKKLSATLKQPTDIETIMKTYYYVKENIEYKKKPAIGAKEVLETGVGKCMDFSDLFVALLRANNIPSKSMFGLVLTNEGGIGYHAWPEAYMKKQGWVQFDPTTGHTDIRMDGKNYKMSIKNKYVILLQGRNEPELHLSRYRCTWKGSEGAEVKFKQSYDLL